MIPSTLDGDRLQYGSPADCVSQSFRNAQKRCFCASTRTARSERPHILVSSGQVKPRSSPMLDFCLPGSAFQQKEKARHECRAFSFRSQRGEPTQGHYWL